MHGGIEGRNEGGKSVGEVKRRGRFSGVVPSLLCPLKGKPVSLALSPLTRIHRERDNARARGRREVANAEHLPAGVVKVRP